MASTEPTFLIRHDLRRTGDLSADTWDYLKFHLQDHYAQCSSGVREQVLDEMQHTLKVIARTFGDKSEPSSDARSNVADFFDKVAILIVRTPSSGIAIETMKLTFSQSGHDGRRLGCFRRVVTLR